MWPPLGRWAAHGGRRAARVAAGRPELLPSAAVARCQWQTTCARVTLGCAGCFPSARRVAFAARYAPLLPTGVDAPRAH